MININLKGRPFNEDRIRDIETALHSINQTIESLTLSGFDFQMLLLAQGLGLQKTGHIVIFEGDFMSIPILVDYKQQTGIGLLLIKDKNGKERELTIKNIKIDMTDIKHRYQPIEEPE